MSNRTKQGYDFTIVSSIKDIEKHVWNSLNIHNKIPLTYEYLQAFEAAPPEGMLFRYVMFHDRGNPCGISIIQLVKISWNIFSKDIKDKKERHRGRGLYVLMGGNSSISGEYGFSFLPGITPKTVYASLSQALKAVKKGLGMHTIVIGSVIKDRIPEKKHRDTGIQGFYALSLLPNMVVPDVDRWENFEAYLAAMKGKYRRRTKSVLKKGARIVRKSLTYKEIQENRETIYLLYLQVHRRAKFRIMTLNPRIFETWKESLGEAFSLDAYYLDGTMVGFSTRFIGDDMLEGYTHGVNYTYNKEYELYQNMLLDDIKVGIEKNVKTISYGRTSIAMKSSVGAVPQDMVLLVRSHIPLFTHIPMLFLQHVAPNTEYCRNPFAEPALS